METREFSKRFTVTVSDYGFDQPDEIHHKVVSVTNAGKDSCMDTCINLKDLCHHGNAGQSLK